MSITQYLLRFDDICPTMNWKVWAEIESVLVQRQLRPLLAVVPDNLDPDLRVDPPAEDFWDQARAWQERGWTIALHGFQHRYVTRNAGLVAVRKKSEFAGLLPEVQREKLVRAMEIFRREGVTPRVWIAPGNTFDATTVALLPEVGIRIICDGYFRLPYVCPLNVSPSPSSGEKGWMTWVPQQLFHFRPAPPGVWTVCYHHNQWSAAQMKKFRQDVEEFAADITSLEDFLGRRTPRESKWSAWLCTHPRLSRLLIRAELKLWSWCSAGRKRLQYANMKPVQLSR